MKELDPAFTYILDTGPAMYMWQGDLTSTEDDIRSIRFMESLRAARGGGVKIEVLNEEQLEGVRAKIPQTHILYLKTRSQN